MFNGETKVITNKQYRSILVVAIAVPIAFLHFVTGAGYQGPFPVFVNGYLIDILLPLSAYFLLCLVDSKILYKWYVKAALVLGFGFAVEFAQYLGYEYLGSTFDPLDLAAYGLGVGTAVLLDLYVFPVVFPFWRKN